MILLYDPRFSSDNTEKIMNDYSWRRGAGPIIGNILYKENNSRYYYEGLIELFEGLV